MFCICRLNFNGIKPALFKRLPYNINFIGFKGNRLETWDTERFSFSLSYTAVKGLNARDPQKYSLIFLVTSSRPHGGALVSPVSH